MWFIQVLVSYKTSAITRERSLVTYSGSLCPSHYHKQLAQNLVEEGIHSAEIQVVFAIKES